ncbi:MAG: hypothetical protein F6K15_12980 [Okeania sp. SIO2B3]|nr:hypothetical protein [Okeania sp. SIO2B3]
MNFNYIKYCQYVIRTQNNYTLTNLADHLEEVSHDQINRYLKNVETRGRDFVYLNI